MQQDLGIYVHWPFCLSKCPYCDFNSHVSDQVDHAAWAEAYVRELRHYRALTGPRNVVSVFFGGGTPSLMRPQTVAAVIDAVSGLWGLPAGAEITLEANPTSVETEKLKSFRAAGVNRVSLGVQALNDADLKRLGRQHSAAEAQAAVKTAARIFDRYTFDLIYARSGQETAAWRAELQEALKYAAGHMSLYQLTIEPGTAFFTQHSRGALEIPAEPQAAEMYEATQEIMEKHGLPAYEISNHAAAGQESRHNKVYWQYGDYAGIGPGAHGRLTLSGAKRATRAHRAPAVWLERVAAEGHGAHPHEEISTAQKGAEMLMMGLRLTAGVDLARFVRETGQTLESAVPQDRLRILQDEGFLERTETSLRATSRGRQRLDAVLAYLM